MAEKAPGSIKPFFPCCGGPVGTMEKCICMVPADQQEQAWYPSTRGRNTLKAIRQSSCRARLVVPALCYFSCVSLPAWSSEAASKESSSKMLRCSTIR